MISKQFKNIKLRKSVSKDEISKKINKFLFINLLNRTECLDLKSKLILLFLKQKTNSKKNSKVLITNRCIFNNRSRGVYRPFGVSRSLLRELMQFGLVPGYSKGVW
jgi:ribosomal protein S14